MAETSARSQHQPPTRADVLATPVAFGRYHLLERLDFEGRTEVYRARAGGDKGEVVVVKRILSTVAASRAAMEQFAAEVEAAAGLVHPTIARIVDRNWVADTYYVALEHVFGRDLRQIVLRLRERRERMPGHLATYLLMKACEGLAHAHAHRDATGRSPGLVHRNVSPQSVLLGYNGDVKLINFGIARTMGRRATTVSGIVKGTYGYMSPEQVRGLPIDPRSDIFSCGILFYELLTGEHPFVGRDEFDMLEKVRNVELRPPSLAAPGVPDELERIACKALAKHADERYQRAMDLQEDLQSYLLVNGEVQARQELQTWLATLFIDALPADEAKLARYRSLSLPRLERDDISDNSATERMDAVDVAALVPDTIETVPVPRRREDDDSPARSAGRWDQVDTQIYDDNRPPAELVAKTAARTLLNMEPISVHVDNTEVARRAVARPPSVPPLDPPPAPPLGPPPAPPLALPPTWDSEAGASAERTPPERPPPERLAASPAARPPVPPPPRMSRPPPGSPTIQVPMPPMPPMPAAMQMPSVPPGSLPATREYGSVLAERAMAMAAQREAMPDQLDMLMPQPAGTVAAASLAPDHVPRRRSRRALLIAAGAVGAALLVLGGALASRWLIDQPDGPITGRPGAVPPAGTAAPATAPGTASVPGGAGTVAALPAKVMAATGFDLFVEPASATVKLDGRLLDLAAPMRIRDLPPGPHELLINAPSGYFSKTQTVVVEAGQAPVVRIELDPVQVRAQFSSEPPGATVVLSAPGSEAVTLGPTPVERMLDPRARYQAVFEKPGFAPVRVEVAPGRGPELPVHATLAQAEQVAARGAPVAAQAPQPAPERRPPRRTDLERRSEPRTGTGRRPRSEPRAEADRTPPPEPERVETVAPAGDKTGVLALGSKPPCRIFVDGEDTGKTTPQRALTLPAGRHQIRLVNDDYDIVETFSVTITADETTRVVKDMSDRLAK
ncbi:MAG TPA: serine/threonine-protein kinase [Haliangium sp.]|nr:serine/threonine-protein kinase [Haliangium sp.]